MENHTARSGSLKNECGSNIEYVYSITRGFMNDDIFVWIGPNHPDQQIMKQTIRKKCKNILISTHIVSTAVVADVMDNNCTVYLTHMPRKANHWFRPF